MEVWRTWKLEDHTNDSIIENGQNTEENLEDLRRFADTQTPLKTTS